MTRPLPCSCSLDVRLDTNELAAMGNLISTNVWRLLRAHGIEIPRTDRCSGIDVLADLRKIDGRSINTTLDVGANVGQSAVRFSKAFAHATIHCFEPAPDSFQAGRLATDHLPSVTWHQVAVGNQDGTADFSDCGTSQISRLTAPNREVEGYSRRRVPILRLDAFCADKLIDSIHLLKTDTEGFDLAVLQGAETLLRRGAVRHILCEVGFSASDKDHSDFTAVAKYLEQFDCRLVYFYGISDVGHFRQFGHCYADALFTKCA